MRSKLLSGLHLLHIISDSNAVVALGMVKSPFSVFQECVLHVWRFVFDTEKCLFYFSLNRGGFCPSQQEKAAQKTSKSVPGGK